MANDLDLTVEDRTRVVFEPPPRRSLVVFDQPLDGIFEALDVGRQAGQVNAIDFGRNDLGYARMVRARHLALFAPADGAMWTLYRALNETLDRGLALAMIGAMLGGLRAKGNNKEAIAAMLDIVESDDIARATSLWEPFEATPVTLALACRRLIATAKFVPQPCELHDALRTARISLISAKRDCETLVDFLRRADATILEFAPREEWIAPYQRATLELMLRLHASMGDAALRALVAREKAELAKLAPPPKRKRIAAASKRSEAKRSAKKDADGVAE